MTIAKRLGAAALVFGMALTLSLTLACASGGGDSTQTSDSGEAKTAPVKGAAPPAGHRMAKLAIGMTPAQVTAVMGQPSNTTSYITGKMFIPWYFGSDSGRRTDYLYAGEGRVVFAINRWSGGMKAVRIDYDPNEDGV